ncbi:hypothetical protein KJS94_09990 [Flavihumibacter rivuli]|uniref:hypothetical protein n=1 Tax=Flavihumibacter rivuli TaxID=2838156 RepID=UPI001BDE3D9C|nr:hypothetical protein [Flavihumibacter rivuli]ULQ54968.1 hypothetical protein KJS94_09990 [Flavihumibacter rivuli]
MIKQFRLILVFFMAIAIVSCSKEESLEEGNIPEPAFGTWSFTEGSKTYSGTVDTAYIETFEDGKVLTIEGINSSNGFLILALGGEDITPGSYIAPASAMLYAEGPDILYESDLLEPGGFTILIEEFDGTTIKGTFSGTAFDPDDNEKVITNGRFSAELN